MAMMAAAGTMTKRCRHCANGVVTLLTSGGRVEMTCHCPRGREMEQRRFGALKVTMLAAFVSVATGGGQ